ncbi:hypothetical protein FB645_002312 [Coemansia sp. IMI 203386]|nr:hypothetical protein FB645_002312 [Coemansia sp. IMI 203386]
MLAFQTLPSHITACILDHVRYSAQWMQKSKADSHLLPEKALLQVSSIWRDAAMQVINRQCTVRITVDETLVKTRLMEWPISQQMQAHTNMVLEHVQKLTLHISIWDVFSGKYRDELGMFRKTTNAEIYLENSDTGMDPMDTGLLDVERNIDGFVNVLQKWCPKLRSCKPVISERRGKWNRYDLFYGNMLRWKLQNHSTVDVAAMYPVCIMDRPLLPNGRLTNIRCTVDRTQALIVQMVMKNSRWLEKLQIKYLEPIHEYDFFLSKKRSVVYPCLTSLVVETPYSAAADTAQSLKDNQSVVVFPALKRLVIRGQYPFASNVCFHGTQDTLQHVDIDLCQKLKKLVNGIDRLTNIVGLRLTVWGTWSIAELRQFISHICNIAQGMQMLDMDTRMMELSADVFAQVRLSRLQTLVLPNAKFAAGDVVELSCRCPMLSNLHSGVCSTVVQVEKHALQGRLGYWNIVNSMLEIPDAVAEAAVAAAIACPRLTLVMFDTPYHSEYTSRIKSLAKKHATHRQRLLKLAT